MIDDALMEKAREVVSEDREIQIIVSVFTMQIEYAASSFAEPLGYTVEEMAKMNARDILGDDSKALMQFIAGLFGKDTEAARTLKRKDGSTIRASGKVQSITYQREPYLVVTGVVFEESAQ